ncbi:MAG TPA: NAD(P)-binding domain-containing protein [Vicinamibacteria bacterium]|nr:NAD(P)-binding domain-containing protein [Vicinamibacteria bacterium]
MAGIIVLPYILGFRKKRHHDRERKTEAARLGIDKPTAQYPFVDAKRCIGCGACVDACPEGDVLGIVGGTATVVNGLKCVGHGKCEEACPVGAIEVGLGDLRSREDIPLMDPWQETSVPGLFVAGELGGLALVKNAMGQGRKVIERISQKAVSARGQAGGDVLDVAIVGTGPAGIAAAAAAHEHKLTYVALEQEPDLGGTIFHYPRRKLVLVQAVDVPLWGRMKEAEYQKEDLLEVLLDLARRFHLNLRFGEKVLEVRREGGVFSLRTPKGVYLSRFVVLALGRRGTPRKLNVPGEELPKVMYQLLDAESYVGQNVLVVGGGDSAVEAALGLARQEGNRVTLSYRREKLVRIKKKNEDRIAIMMKEGRVEAIFNSEVVDIVADKVRLKVGTQETTVPNDYVFVFAGGEPPFGFLRQIGVRFGGNEKPASVPRARV